MTNEQDEIDVVELGVASVETQGGALGVNEFSGRIKQSGLSTDD